jgi:ATP/maltotriose-dependent transcriptional regulator MalT
MAVFETQETAIDETSLSASHCGALCLSAPSFLCYTHRCWVIGQDAHHLSGRSRRKGSMPKPSKHALLWSEEHQSYDLHINGQLRHSFRPHDESAWLAWVHEHTTVAFQGQAGHLSLVKEARPRGSSYWYAYRRQAGRTQKRYLGPTARLTLAHLEQIATELTRSSSPSAQAPVDKAPLSSEQRSSLLCARLSAPRLPNWLVERSRLLRELDAVRAYPLTLVSASAGSGKTTLLSAWMAAAQSGRASERKAQGIQAPQTVCAWLSLDALDRDPTRFWTSVIAALRTALPTVGRTALAWFHSPEAPPISAILTNLLTELEQINRDMILILDDYQVISEQSIQEAMLFWLEHLPANVHQVLVTRSDPAFPLSRLRMRGQLLELRDQDLRFSQAEASRFLVQGMGLPLSEEEVAILQTRTEGWVAGLQLAALSLRKREDRSTFVKDFAGSHRYLLDYVQQDILAQLPAPLQEFLLQTAILPRMNAPICQAVTVGPSLQASQQMLEELERANLFVVPLDEQRQWYRYHDLFREALLARLSATQPERLPQFHLRAARFYEAQGEMREAIAHALVALDFPYAARLMEREAPRLWLHGEAQAVQSWIAALPDAVLWQHAPLALNATLRLMESLQEASEVSYVRAQTQVEHTIARLEAMLYAHERGAGRSEGEPAPKATEPAVIGRRLHLLRALIETRALLRRGDKDRLSRLARELEALGQDEEIGWNMIAHAIAFWLTGLFEREGTLLIPRLLEAKQQAQQAGNLLASIRVMEWLAFAYLRAGQFSQVERECLEGLALIAQSGGRTMWEGYLHLFLARAYYAWNRLEEAVGSIQQTLRIAQDWQQADLLVTGNLHEAWIELARGDLAVSSRSLQQAEALIQQERLARHASWMGVLRVQYWLAAGDLEATRHWAEHTAFSPQTWDPEHTEAVLMLARVYLARQQYIQALEVLDGFRQQLDRPGDLLTVIDFLALHAIALHRAGKRAQAAGVAARLLALTLPQGNIRVYLDAGEPMKHLLKTLLAGLQEGDPGTLAASLSRPSLVGVLAAFEQEEGGSMPGRNAVAATTHKTLPRSQPNAVQPGLIEPLSRQEQQVLRLLVAGRTYAEMAQALIVSIHTIKTQVSSIYRKLGVNRRAEAIAATRQFSLL